MATLKAPATVDSRVPNMVKQLAAKMANVTANWKGKLKASKWVMLSAMQYRLFGRININPCQRKDPAW